MRRFEVGGEGEIWELIELEFDGLVVCEVRGGVVVRNGVLK